MIFPSPKNSTIKINSFSKFVNVKYAILSVPICSIFVNFARKRSLRNLLNILFGSIESIFLSVIHIPMLDTINMMSGFVG